MTLPRARRGKAGKAAGLAAAGVAAAVLAGCSAASSSSAGTGSGAAGNASSASSAASPSSTATAAPTSTGGSTTPASTAPASTSPSSAASSPASGSAAGGGGPKPCSSADLRLSLGTASGTAGSVYQDIEFKNASASSCTLYGFPGVSLLAQSRQIGAAATRSASSHPSLVTLGPGQVASALMRVAEALNYPSSTCHPVAATTLRVYPPNQTTPLTVAYSGTGCTATSVKLIQVSAVQAGTASS